MDYQIVRTKFAAFVDTGTPPERLCTGLRWTEGPLYIAEDTSLLFSDIPNNRVMRWSETDGLQVHVDQSAFTNGQARDLHGNWLCCEHGGRRVVRRDKNGVTAVIVDRYQGRRLNSPNDLVVTSDGAIWFSDPPYGINSNVEGYEAPSEQNGSFVFRVDPVNGEVECVAADFDKPNGLAFSPDERTLYIADSGAIEGASKPAFNAAAPHHIRAFDVVDSKRLCNGRVFVDIAPGVPDGLKVDHEGYVWTSAADGVHCYDPRGILVGKILLPEVTSNLCFGGPDGSELFITATGSVYRVRTSRRSAALAAR